MICPKTFWQIHNLILLTPIKEHTTIAKGGNEKEIYWIVFRVSNISTLCTNLGKVFYFHLFQCEL
jgi:hypothetical protein